MTDAVGTRFLSSVFAAASASGSLAGNRRRDRCDPGLGPAAKYGVVQALMDDFADRSEMPESTLYPSRFTIGTLTDMDADRVLVARLVSGDDSALAEIFARYAGLVLCVARRVLPSASLAEDVVQEVFSNLWEHPDRFDPERGSLRAYLGVQAQRRALDLVRSDQRRKAREERCDRLAPNSECDDVDRLAEADSVRQAIARLPAAQRQTVELMLSDGRPHRDIAVLLGVPEGTVKSRLRLAHAKLAKWLGPLESETTV